MQFFPVDRFTEVLIGAELSVRYGTAPQQAFPQRNRGRNVFPVCNSVR
jgi:hypothetical protein